MIGSPNGGKLACELHDLSVAECQLAPRCIGINSGLREGPRLEWRFRRRWHRSGLLHTRLSLLSGWWLLRLRGRRVVRNILLCWRRLFGLSWLNRLGGGRGGRGGSLLCLR